MSIVDIGQRLPTIDALLRRARSIAMIEAVLMPDEERRRYFFADAWRPDGQLFWMDDNVGNDLSIAFVPQGALIKGFHHESPLSPSVNDDEVWPGMMDGIPDFLQSVLEDPSLIDDDGILSATFLAWRTPEDRLWRHGDLELAEVSFSGTDIDGSGMLFPLIDETPLSYLEAAESYYDRQIAREAAIAIWRGDPLTDSVIRELNASADVLNAREEAGIIGYQVQ
ncbi:hypothetical protein Ait01nite_083920 [Actinoplanes italicus]|uniref:hypothetical protein n=1 Tax=Actinoplanes italicus TaxID=113567 RepID=UPI0011B239BC|nr:hypothetical protein [Actinoplanes italicus]GIE35347.1 hypothetical protein Ait01nite_083920 [Actinoplanes italicus]